MDKATTTTDDAATAPTGTKRRHGNRATSPSRHHHSPTLDGRADVDRRPAPHDDVAIAPRHHHSTLDSSADTHHQPDSDDNDVPRHQPTIRWWRIVEVFLLWYVLFICSLFFLTNNIFHSLSRCDTTTSPGPVAHTLSLVRPKCEQVFIYSQFIIYIYKVLYILLYIYRVVFMIWKSVATDSSRTTTGRGWAGQNW